MGKMRTTDGIPGVYVNLTRFLDFMVFLIGIRGKCQY